MFGRNLSARGVKCFRWPVADVRDRRVLFRSFLGESKKTWAKKQLKMLAHHGRPGSFFPFPLVRPPPCPLFGDSTLLLQN